MVSVDDAQLLSSSTGLIRDSSRLRPHESSNIDVILIGHSMGGILSAEVALLGLIPTSGSNNTSHRVLGTISLDTPFLGMHPGVIASGIGSLFRSTPTAPGAATGPTGSEDPSEISITKPTSNDVAFDSPSHTSLQSENEQAIPPFLEPTNDPNYNAPFPNDVRMAARSGWANALHFINKHSDDLTKATKSSLASYFEFGGCMADYNGLKTRYSRLRALEDVESHQGRNRRRIRFVNYYTASTGRLKHNQQRSKLGPSDEGGLHPNESTSDIPGNRTVATEVTEMSIHHEGTLSHASSLRGSREEHLDDEVVAKPYNNPGDTSLTRPLSPELEREPGCDTSTTFSRGNNLSLSENARGQATNEGEAQIVDDTRPPIVGDVEEIGHARDDNISDTEPRQLSEVRSLDSSRRTDTSCLPPIPPQPEQPPPFDPTPYSDRDIRKLAEKEQSRQLKAYQRAVQDRDQAIKDRRKLVEKRKKEAKHDHEKQLKKEGKEIAKMTTENKKKTPGPAKGSNKEPETGDAADNENLKAPKPKRDKKFCLLPSKINGDIDPCWVRVYMRDVDEVGAHCGLFFVGPHYEWLINDVGERIKAWVGEK